MEDGEWRQKYGESRINCKVLECRMYDSGWRIRTYSKVLDVGRRIDMGG
jgi:hypothetical protein